MPQIIQPEQVRVVTKDGEVHLRISLDINLNLNTGNITVTPGAEAIPAKPKETKADETMWEVPDFTSTPKIDFGKQ